MAIVNFIRRGWTEAQDWAEILLRMYLRWCDRRGYRKDFSNISPAKRRALKA